MDKGKKMVNTLKSNGRWIFYVVLSGIMTAIAFSYPAFDWLAWLSLVPYLYTLINRAVNVKSGFIYAFLFGMTFYLGLLTWLFWIHPLDWMGFSNTQSFLLISLGWIVFSMIEALGLSLVGIAMGLLKPSGWGRIFVPTLVWVVVEWIQGLGAAGFTWGRLAISQFQNILTIQSAALFGSLFISALIVLVNALLAVNLIDSIKAGGTIRFQYIAIGLVVFTSNLNFGWVYLHWNQDEGKPLKVSVIQGNIASVEKWKDGGTGKTLDTYLRLSYQADQKQAADIIIWPETPVPVVLKNYKEIVSKYKKLASDTGSFFITGGFDEEKNAPDEKTYNAIFSFNPEGEMTGTYYKRHLVPFGEYLPFRSILEWMVPGVGEMNMLEGDITPGEDTNLVETPWGKIGGIICFESILPHLVRNSVNDGAEVLVVVTNDSWYKDSIGVYQHNAQSVFRAVETNRYVVRAANTGVSSVISPRGKIIEQLDPLKEGFIHGSIVMNKQKTLYSRLGDIIAWISLAGIVLYGIRTKKVSKG